MLRNYLTIALRNIARHRLYSTINIICLSVGICFSTVVGVYIWQQRSVNSELRNADRLFLLKSIYKQKDQGYDLVSISPLAKKAVEDYPSLFANYYRFNPVTNVVSAGDRHFRENIAISDTSLVSMLGFPMLEGDPAHAFANNSSAVITEAMARKLYGRTDVIGKTLSIQTLQAGLEQNYSVSAVLKNFPYNSVTGIIDSAYSVFIPVTGNRFFSDNDFSVSWDFTNEISFLELKAGVKPQQALPVLNALVRKNSSDFVWKNMQVGMEPVRTFYLDTNGGAVRKMIMILSVIAAFILLMVIINFINITIGTSGYRLKEIGLRKTFGGLRGQLMTQFISEALLMALTGALGALFAYQLLLPVFGRALNTSLPTIFHWSAYHYLVLLALVLLIGLLAGIYPAFVLSAVRLPSAAKGKIIPGGLGLSLKRSLLVLQFALAILVFTCTINITRQVSYIFHKDLGYQRDQMMVVTAFPKQWDSAGVQKMETIKKGLLALPGVSSAVLCFDPPDNTPFGRIVVFPPGQKTTGNGLNLPVSQADEDYAKTMSIPMVSGSFFEGQNRMGIVLNETAVRELGLDPANATGQTIGTLGQNAPITILGVMKDFHFSSLQEKIGPLGFFHVSNNTAYRYLLVRLGGQNIAATIDAVKKTWKSFAPNAPFDYSFMDEKFAALYRSELQLKAASNIASVLNLIIVLLGIIGVVAFTLAKRDKEIAVRKVLGAGIPDIIAIFLKEYMFLLLLATAIGGPLAWLATEKLLQHFAYHIQQGPLTYMAVLVFVTAVTALLIGMQCLKVAKANPVKSLRAE